MFASEDCSKVGCFLEGASTRRRANLDAFDRRLLVLGVGRCEIVAADLNSLWDSLIPKVLS
jgi:hypothetical protein